MRYGKWKVRYHLKCCVIVNALIECKIAFFKVVRQSLKSFYKHPSQVQVSIRTGSLCSRQNTCLKPPYCSDRGTRAPRLAVSLPELTGHHNTSPTPTT